MFRPGEPLAVDQLRVRSALLFSDVHLSDSDPELTECLLQWLSRQVLCADTKPEALFILGDLFDLWVGDDWLDALAEQSAAKQLIKTLSAISAQGVHIGLMHGNRDFLLRTSFTRAIHATLLSDPCSIRIDGGASVVLSHGDRLCTNDKAYQELRRLVRDPQWQSEFLAKGLDERLLIAAKLRDTSEKEVSGKRQEIMDITPSEAVFLCDRLDAEILIHGHTHRPGASEMSNHKLRWVLSDWSARPKRGGGLWMDAHGIKEVPV